MHDFPTPRSGVRRLTRCITALAITYRRNSSWHARPRVRPARSLIARELAPTAIRGCRSPREPSQTILKKRTPFCGVGIGVATRTSRSTAGETTQMLRACTPEPAHLKRQVSLSPASSGENSRRKLQNVVANSSAENSRMSWRIARRRNEPINDSTRRRVSPRSTLPAPLWTTSTEFAGLKPTRPSALRLRTSARSRPSCGCRRPPRRVRGRGDLRRAIASSRRTKSTPSGPALPG